MNNTLAAILSIPSSVSRDMAEWKAKRHRIRRFRKMQETAAKQANPQTFGFKVGEIIETGNHPIVRHSAVKVGGQ